MKSNLGCNEIESACITCNLILKVQDIPETQTIYFLADSLKYLKNARFHLTTSDLYFTILVEVFTNLIFAKNKYFTNQTQCTENKIAFLKPAHKYQIARYVSILKMSYRRFPASNVFRRNDRSCTVWVPKLVLGKKNPPSMFLVI